MLLAWRNAAARRPVVACLAAAMLLAQGGCVNIGVMFGKVMFGDPKQTSVFEQRTGISLLKTQKKLAVICTAPTSISSEFDSIQHDVQEEVTRRLRIRKLNVARIDDVSSALYSSGGRFNQDAMARALPDVDYLVHIDVERFTHKEDGSPDLYRGRCNGIVYVYEIERAAESAERPRPLKVFFQEFNLEYPASQPVSVEQTPIRVFRQRCVDQLADTIGRTFYDVNTSELFN
jgi:hypothetical protein